MGSYEKRAIFNWINEQIELMFSLSSLPLSHKKTLTLIITPSLRQSMIMNDQYRKTLKTYFLSKQTLFLFSFPNELRLFA
jgi:hypothetical protein